MRAVALVRDFLKARAALARARSALNGALDVFKGHVLGAGPLHREPQSEVGFRVAPTLSGGDGYFTSKFGEKLAPLGISSTLLSLDCGPFAVSRHGAPLYL